LLDSLLQEIENISGGTGKKSKFVFNPG